MSKQSKEKSKTGNVILIVLAVFIVLTLLGVLLRCSIPKRPDTPTAPPSFEMEFDTEGLIF